MKEIKITILCLWMSLFSVNLALGQSLSVTGKVKDQNNNPLEFVSVGVKGSNNFTKTDLKGAYKINMPNSGNVVLVFSSLGYTTKEITTKQGETIYDITLVESINFLNEVVVVGYGTSRKADLTGSIGSVNMTDLQKAPVTSFDKALAGRVAGVQVSASDGQPGADMNIVIRGNNSITQANSPLYVVDGFPIETSLNSLINPAEIESIEVLKDASATAIYGARGANGVIIITTKKGKEGKAVFNYNNFLGLQNEVKRQEVMSPYEFVKYQIELNPTLYTPVYLSNGKTLDSYRNVEGTDWQDLLFQTAVMQNHSLSLSGGSEKTKYMFSGSFLDQDGIIVNGGFNRYQGRFVLDQSINSKVKTGINVNYSSSKRYGTQVGSAQTSPTSTMMYSIWGYRPITGNPLSDYNLEFEPFDPNVDPATDLRFNPLLTAQNTFRPTFNNTLLANTYLEYSPLTSLTLRISGGLTRNNINSQVFNNSKTQSGNPISSVNGVNGSISNSELNNYLNENTLTYTPNLSKNHKLSLLGGFTVQKINVDSYGFTAIAVPNESLGMSGLDEGTVTTSSSRKSSNSLASFLGRVNYNFKSKYLLTASFRADGSSKFDINNQWSYFPSASGAWRFIDESFMKSLKFLSDGKIRAGYGLTGNNRVSDFAYLSSYTMDLTSGYTLNNAPVKGTIPETLGTRDLKWETTAQINVGLDLGLFNNKVTFTADYYEKTTKDLLLNASLAPSMGYLKGFKNIGKVSNKGFEFSINTTNIDRKDFGWSTNFNITFNRNKVLELNEGQPNLQTSITWGNFSSAPYIAIPGKPIALFNGYKFSGVYQYSDFNQLANGTYELKAEVPNNGQPRSAIQPGYVKYEDINNDGQVNSSDITTIGNPNAKHIGGFSNNFRYKAFDLNVFLQWSYGNDLINVNRIQFEGGEPRNYLNQFASFSNRWTPENQTNDLYKVGGQGPLVYSSRIIEDGSYLRLKTVSFGYNLPASVLKAINIKTLRLFASGQNLLTWTNYSGIDPEVSVRNSSLTPGFDLSAYPQSKTYTFGLNLTL